MRLPPVLADPDRMLVAVADAFGAPTRLVGELDVDVYRVRSERPGPDLVVRAFSPAVGASAVPTVVEVLTALADTRFPAERCARDGAPVLTIGVDGEQAHLLVTEYVEPRPAPKPGFVLAWCAGLLAHLALRAGRSLPPGGGWHRLGLTPASEIDAALNLAADLGAPAGELLEALADADDADGLPSALIHPDLTTPNAVPQGSDPPIVIDWAGVGRGPRIWPLAWLLYTAGPPATKVVLERYARTITLTDEEWSRLPDVMIARPLSLDLWSVAHERMTLPAALTRSRHHRARVQSTVAAARSARESHAGPP